MKWPHKIIIASLTASIIALAATSYFYIKATKNHEQTISYLNAIQEKQEWLKAREELQENNRQLRSALRKKICPKKDPELEITPNNLTIVEDSLSVPTAIMESRPYHRSNKTYRLMERARVDLLEENIRQLKGAQRQGIALDRIDARLQQIEERIRLLNPLSKYRWTYDEECIP